MNKSLFDVMFACIVDMLSYLMYLVGPAIEEIKLDKKLMRAMEPCNEGR